MASRLAPSTPTTVPQQATPSADPTGNWRHPRFDEINRRLEATTFGERHIKRILWRLSSLALVFLVYEVNKFLHWQLRLNLLHTIRSLLPYSVCLFIYPILPILLLGYALLPLRPLFMTPDNLTDIALTPKQRQLLGLKPASQPPTPGSTYITPPRYSRSATPRSLSSSQSGSPFSGKGSPLGTGATPSYSPTASPLFQKAMGKDAARRLSFGSPSPLGLSRGANDSNSPLASMPTPSPLTGKGASSGLNNRWLYERGRRSSSGLRLYS